MKQCLCSPIYGGELVEKSMHLKKKRKKDNRKRKRKDNRYQTKQPFTKSNPLTAPRYIFSLKKEPSEN